MSQLPGLPSPEQLAVEMRNLAQASQPAQRALEAVRSGVFVDGAGARDELGEVRLAPIQLGLLAYLARTCPTPLSVDVGFGMGMSATIILAAKAARGGPFEHIAFDPYGLPDGRGQVVERYLQGTFAFNFRRFRDRSEVGLPRLFAQRGPACCGLVVIDGDHRFDQVITDFFLADLLIAPGGYIMFDDALYPAIESAVSYVAANRPDYVVTKLPYWNTSVAQKARPGRPSWDSFTPFNVAQRHNWTEATTGLPKEFP